MGKLSRKEFIVAASSFAALAFIAPKIFFKFLNKDKILPEDLALGAGNFKSIYLDDRKRAEFKLFLQNVFHLYPEDEFHDTIYELTKKLPNDREIYLALMNRIESLKPMLGDLTYSLPALKKQKQEMARQTGHLLDGYRAHNRYLEIGTTGRHVDDVCRLANFSGPVHLINDIAPDFSVPDILERGGLKKRGEFSSLDNYSPISTSVLEDNSVDLATVFIGFHHSPTERLLPFLDSIYRTMIPGSVLIVRDHDASDEYRNVLVALAHDVFNAGLHYSWTDTVKQVRNFKSLAELRSILLSRGFESRGNEIYQDGDPTKNALMKFIRV